MFPAAKSQHLLATGTLITGRALLRGWSLYNAHATDPEGAIIYDSATTTTVKPVAHPTAPAKSDSTRMPTGLGIYVEQGIYCVLGTDVVLTVYYSAETRVLDLLAAVDEDASDIGAFRLQLAAAGLGSL